MERRNQTGIFHKSCQRAPSRGKTANSIRYDLRNRFYSPDLGRFLQPDPSGFNGDATNLYRYCGNNPVTRSDPFGLGILDIKSEYGNTGGTVELEPVIVTGTDPGNPVPNFVTLGGPGGWGEPGGGPAVYEPVGHLVGDKYVHDYNPFPRLSENTQPSVQQPAPSSVPAQDPTAPSDTSESLLPSSSGVIVVADAASGFVEGAAGTYSLMFGGFTPGTGGTRWAGFETHGAFIGSPRAGVSAVSPRSVNQAPGVVGANAALGFGAWFSNAQKPSAVLGPFAMYSISNPLFGASYSYSYSNGQLTYVVILTLGPTLGGSYNAYPTFTDPLGY